MVIAQGRIDLRGCLVGADPPLARLHGDAGGRPGGELAIPQLAVVARLAMTRAEPVSQAVLVADGDVTRELQVTAFPDRSGVNLSIDGWANIAHLPAIASLPDVDFDYARLEADGAWRTDRALRLARMAAGIDRDIGFIAASARGSAFTHIFRLLPDAAGDMPILAALANAAPFSDQPAELIPAGGRPVLLSGAPQFDASGRFDGLGGQLRFVVPLNEVPIATDPPQDDLSDAIAARLEPSLRDPILRIVADADAAALQVDGPLRQDYVRYAGDIAGAARHLLGLVEDLANLQTIEHPDFRITTEAADVADIIHRAAGLLRVRLAERHIRTNLPDRAAGVFAKGDFGRLLQILVNLLGNAVRHSPEGGLVCIDLHQQADRVSIHVTDEGPGIAAADQARIFEKFVRLDPADKVGSGLGLYISRRLARAMGGDLYVESAAGQGARFTLALQR